MSSTNTFLVEIDGKALPDDLAPLLTAALVDDSQRFPDLFELRFRDPAHLVLPKSGAKVGLHGEDLGVDERTAGHPAS